MSEAPQISVVSTEGQPVLATVVMVVPGLVLALNRSYRPVAGRGGKRKAWMLLTPEAREYKERIMSIARLAVLHSPDWPKDPWQPTHVRLSTYVFNSNTDAGAANKLIADALEGDDHSGILYVDDEVVSWGESPKPAFDANGPRLIIYAELLSMQTPEETELRRASIMLARAKRGEAKERKAARAMIARR
jgi:hypothetical protein